MDTIYQTNAVASLPLNLNVNHLRILMAIVLHLQDTIKAGLQRPASNGNTREPCILTIPVSDFHLGKCTGTRLRSCLDDLCLKNGLIDDYIFPLYSHDVIIYLTPKVTRLLTNTQSGYFSYSRTLALSTTSKYTLRLYWLISSWRNRGGFVIRMDEFRKILCLGQAYHRFDNIAARILQPSQQELQDRFPICFQYKYYPGTPGTGARLAFKIRLQLAPADEKRLRADTYDTCFHLLSSTGLSSALPVVDPIFNSLDAGDLRPFLHHLTKVLAHIRTHTISSPAAYLKTALTTWLTDWTLRYGDD